MKQVHSSVLKHRDPTTDRKFDHHSPVQEEPEGDADGLSNKIVEVMQIENQQPSVYGGDLKTGRSVDTFRRHN